MLQLTLRYSTGLSLRPRLSARLYHNRTIFTSSELIEEETLPRYRPEVFYPVSIGQTLHNKYKILAKLGFGSESTVWLAKDITKWRFQKNQFVTLKVYTADQEHDASRSPEVRLSDLVARADPTHEGLQYLRTTLDSFKIEGQTGHHLCLAYVPMRENLSTFQRRLRNHRVPIVLLRPLLRFLLLGLDYLHTRCHVIHTDLKPDNVLLGIEDDQIIHDLIQQEQKYPSPAKILSDRCIYPHRNFGDMKKGPGRPKLGDFGLAVHVTQDLYYHPIQPDCLQAPEVILGAGWSYSADIWNLGVMIWDSLEARPLFHAGKSEDGIYAPEMHLAEMVAVLGRPPQSLLQRGKYTSRYFTQEGDLISKDIVQLPVNGLENTVSVISDEEKKEFLQFVRRMLSWLPEERATARELLSDPWFRP